jgi:hypothetical protein
VVEENVEMKTEIETLEAEISEVSCTLHTAQCTLHIAHCTLYCADWYPQVQDTFRDKDAKEFKKVPGLP